MIKTNKIIVLGGGSAGWMTAATLISQFPNKDITVIESPTTPTVGVGESTLGHINHWLKLLNIKDEDFMPHTDASYKLSIRFENFYKKGDGGFHYPFGTPYEKDLSRGKESWFFDDKPKCTYAEFISSQMALVNNNTFITKDESNQFPKFNWQFDTAYHFDATKFGTWLRENYCKPRGVKHIVDDIYSIADNHEGINSLEGKKDRYTADFYIDCTGFKSMLFEEMGVKFNSYEDLLPNNRAWATRIPYKDKRKELVPYTNCTAIDNGWVWNIPSWERIGTGYVYSNKFITDEEALEEFKKYLDEKGSDYSNSEFKNIKMRVGLHDKIFYKNACAIGLSAGFIEPLESNGLMSVHEFLKRLVRIMSRDDESISQYDIDGFNYHCKQFFDDFSGFVASHYALSHRDDTEYWRNISSKSFMSLKNSNFRDYFINDTKVIHTDKMSFKSEYGMSYVSVGLNLKPFTKVDTTLAYDHEIKKWQDENNYRYGLVDKWNNIAKQKDSLYDYLNKHIHKEK